MNIEFNWTIGDDSFQGACHTPLDPQSLGAVRFPLNSIEELMTTPSRPPARKNWGSTRKVD
jgi:hypothetical protein